MNFNFTRSGHLCAAVGLTSWRQGSMDGGEHRIWKKIPFVFYPVAGHSQIQNSLLDTIKILIKAEY